MQLVYKGSCEGIWRQSGSSQGYLVEYKGERDSRIAWTEWCWEIFNIQHDNSLAKEDIWVSRDTSKRHSR